MFLSYLREAIDFAEQGLRLPKEGGALDLPNELVEALDGDPGLAEAFHGLARGRQKSYAMALPSAKTSATRVARTSRFRNRITPGQSAQER